METPPSNVPISRYLLRFFAILGITALIMTITLKIEWKEDMSACNKTTALPLAAGIPPLGEEDLRRTIPRTTAKKCKKKTIQELSPNLKSQSEEDQILLEHFNGLCGGTYLEMGALDGVKYSNSFVFNAAFDWKGVLVELTKKSFQKLQKNRKNELALVNAGICKEAQMIHLVDTGFGAVSGIWEFASESFREKWWSSIKSPDELPTIECRPLQDILDEVVASDAGTNTDHTATFFFDFFSLDVEGAELAVLESIDWNRTEFGMLFLEADGSNAQKEFDTIALMNRHGYRFLYKRQRSFWFVHKNYAEIYQHLM